MQGKKAVFLGVSKIHSKNKNQDYRKVEFYTPLFQDAQGFMRGGVSAEFTALDSSLGNDIPLGAIVRPVFDYDPYSKRDTLTALEIVAPTPYKSEDFRD